MSDFDAKTRWKYIATFTAFVCSVKLSARVVCCFGVQQITVVGTLRSGVWTRILMIRFYISVQKRMWKDTKRKHSAWSHEARWRLGKRPEMVPWPRMKRRGVCHSVYQGGVTGEHAAGPVPCANAIRVYIADMVVERICCALLIRM